MLTVFRVIYDNIYEHSICCRETLGANTVATLSCPGGQELSTMYFIQKIHDLTLATGLKGHNKRIDDVVLCFSRQYKIKTETQIKGKLPF